MSTYVDHLRVRNSPISLRKATRLHRSRKALAAQVISVSVKKKGERSIADHGGMEVEREEDQQDRIIFPRAQCAVYSDSPAILGDCVFPVADEYNLFGNRAGLLCGRSLHRRVAP